MKKAKIICTIGPATISFRKITGLIKAGMNVARLNFSHGDYKFFRKAILNIKRVRKAMGVPVAIMQDLQGPKIRVDLIKDPVTVKRGEEIIIAEKKCCGKKFIGIDIRGLYKYVKPNNTLLINDGLVSLKVREVIKEKKRIVCTVKAGGEILPRKGVNLPGVKLPIEAMTEKDKKDLRFGLSQGVDIVSLSFVSSGKDIADLKKLIGKKRNPIVIAKIEKPDAVKDIKRILNEADGIMIARGDLAVEIGYSRVPLIQKQFIKRANEKGKLVIVATQMLESMIKNPYPQRAEITDIYNAVLDGADTLMLSGETSVGKYPLKVVRIMSELIKSAETDRDKKRRMPEFIKTDRVYENIISYAGALGPVFMSNTAVAVCTHDLEDIKYLSDYRPKSGIISFTSDEELYCRLAIFNGVYPVLVKDKTKKRIVNAVKERFTKIKNLVYIDHHDHGAEKGRMQIYKIK